MRWSLALLLWALAVTGFAQPAQLTLAALPQQSWHGEAVAVVVELRARGSFAGAPSFDLPEVPGALILRVGNPVVSSEEVAGQSWFVQRHEFALIAERSGTIEVPAFKVRFAAREGFSGSAIEQSLEVPGWSIFVRRPPGLGAGESFVTATDYRIDEDWEIQPEQVRAGDVLVRRIHQQADGTSGMVLPPAPAQDTAGLRVYRGGAEVSDHSERGVFRGERIDTLSYLPVSAGHYRIEALSLRWWNPVTEQLQTLSLPEREIVVLAGADSRVSIAQWNLALLVTITVVTVLTIRWLRSSRRLPTPITQARSAVRALMGMLLACRRNDAHGAYRAWWAWRECGNWPARPTPRLATAVAALQHHLYADDAHTAWSGRELARAALLACRHCDLVRQPGKQDLPALNP